MVSLTMAAVDSVPSSSLIFQRISSFSGNVSVATPVCSALPRKRGQSAATPKPAPTDTAVIRHTRILIATSKPQDERSYSWGPNRVEPPSNILSVLDIRRARMTCERIFILQEVQMSYASPIQDLLREDRLPAL